MVSSLSKEVLPIITYVSLPAYDAYQQGHLFHLELRTTPSATFSLTTHGMIAEGLMHALKRVVLILAGLHHDWQPFKKHHYHLVSGNHRACVRDARSSGLPLCLALLNMLRAQQGLNQIEDLTGTGILRLDGSFEEAHLENVKKEVALNNSTHFLTSYQCNHVFKLATLMNG